MRLAILSGVAFAASLLVAVPASAQSRGGGQGRGQHGGGGGGGRHAGARPAASPVAAPASAGVRGGNAAADIDSEDSPDVPQRHLAPFHVAPPKKHRKIEPNTPIATYPGFRMLEDGSSRVFVEVSRKVDVVETKSTSRVSYRIKGAFAPVRTNRLPLLTDFFHSPVERVQLVEDGDDLELVIDLREAGDAQHRLVDTEGGMLLQVDFGKSTSIPAPSAEPAPIAPIAPAPRTTETKTLGSPAPTGERGF